MAGNYVEELAAFLGWEVDSSELKEFDKQVQDVTDSVKAIAAAVGAAVVGMTAFVAITNKTTAMNTMLARSAGASAQTVEDMGRLFTVIGGNEQSAIKTFEFLNKTVGALKSGATPLTQIDARLKGIGLRFKDIENLTPEQQFKTVLQAAKDTEDAQLGAAAATALFGREAGKIVGYLKTQKGTVEEIFALQAQMNLQTEEGRDGAVRFFAAMDLLDAAATSARQSFAGLIGEGLSPLLESVISLIAANRELIQAKIKEWADRTASALIWVYTKIKDLTLWVKKTVDQLGGFEKVLKVVAIALGSMFGAKVLMMITQFITLMRAAGMAALFTSLKVALIPAAIAAFLALFYLLGEDLYYFFTGGESALGKIGDKIAEFAQQNITPFIASLLGMTPEEFDLALVRVVSAVSNFFTKSIPAAYDAMVNALGAATEWAVDNLGPIVMGIKDFYVDAYTGIYNFVKGILESLYQLIIGNFDKAIARVKQVLSSLPGVSGALGIDFGGAPGPVPMTASVGARGAAASAAAAISNSSSSAQVNAPISITQRPGENGQDLARRIQDELGKTVHRAVKRARSGRDV